MAFSISIHSLLIPSKPQHASSYFFESNLYSYKNVNRKVTVCRAMVEGPSAAYAREMERLSAKESLLVALRDAGGFEGLVTGKTTNMQRMDVNERIVSLERLNPTPRPTTSPFLEGKWNFEWLGFIAAQFLFESGFARLSKLDVVIKDTYANFAASLKFLNSIESNIIISSRLSVEGPLRMKQEFLQGLLESPKVNEESVPQQLRGAFGQASTTLQQLPIPIPIPIPITLWDGGLKVPLGGSLERFLMMSYLDDEILMVLGYVVWMRIIRDSGGVPQVLTRLDPGPSLLINEYES